MTRLTGPGGDFELVEEDVLGARMQVFKNRARSLGEVLADSARFGDRDYIVTASERLSFAEHLAQVASLATALRDEYGVRPGDRVAVNAANSPAWIVSFWATVALGAVAVGYNAWWSRREVAYAIGHTEPVVLIADAKRAEPVEGDVTILTVEDDIPRLARSHPDAALPTADVAEDDPAVILYTSGTSGRPKGAVHSHRSVTSVIEYHRMNDAIARAFGDPTDSADRRYLLALPLFHIAGLHNLAVPRLATGSAVVMHQGAFDVDRVLRLIEKERVTNWGAVPTMAHRLIEHGDLSAYDLSSLTAFALASAPSSTAFKERLRKALPVARQALVDSYGLTETSTAVSVATPADLAEAPGTLGRPTATVRVEIRDPLGEPLPEGEEGEICVRSPFNMLGYWKDPAATELTIRADRWLHTGDIGVIEQGRLRLTTRRSDLILRGGENVYPAEIENVLAEHPAVLECVVIGVPHPDLGQEVMAVVVTNGEHPVSEEELRAHTRGELAYFKVPSRWRITTEPLPRNATGKVVRHHVEISVSGRSS
ncbi:class I adenylate-forming enzyme family protein [Microtetraspora sp. NBRC 16547]|uniref:class I adenylate-forming enzyme family protein n=1 Tax=Microtetraspora sp. NBRC 16547 TaxID=3030993 RepID=UPI0024A44520|nr:class I adenylate-forming enzyme family protein [Microtetraspora sp. NBRC 16547]GLW99196.1 long-chain-fatty-acid--CoA ligase [Microtetraspora sp. NBRC 16547]